MHVKRPRWPVLRLEVAGESMLPTLHPGDGVVVLRTRRVQPGDLVACTDPRAGDRTMIKRLSSGPPYIVLGDNPDASTDSRHFGPIDKSGIIGRLVYRYRPDRRRGRLSGRAPAPRS